MAYRTECKKSFREFYNIFKNFLTNPVSMDEVDYSEAQGNGNIENINFNYNNVKTEEWTLTYSSDNNNFSVSGSVSGDKGTADINKRYDNDIISFTIRNGSNAWQDGDVVKINCYKSSSEPFKLINSGVYRQSLYGELEGNTNLTIQDNSNGYIPPSINGKADEHDYILSRAVIRCDSIDTDHKFNKTDVAIHLSILTNTSNETTTVYLDNFTSDTTSDETTKTIEVSLPEAHLYLLGQEVDLYDYTENISSFGGITHITLNITNDSGNVDIYINGSLFKSVVIEDLKNASYRIYRIYIPAGISFYTWDRLLTSDEIQGIADNKGFPSKDNADDYYSSLLNNRNFANYVILGPSNKFGFFFIDFGKGFIEYRNVLSAKWLPTSGNIAGRYQAFDLYRKMATENYYPFVRQYIDFGSLDTILEKFWIIQDGNSLLIALKHFDPTKNNNNVYQLFYAGWTIHNTMYDLPVVIGMKNKSFNWWNTNDSDYRFGLNYNKNISVWCSPIEDNSSLKREFGWYNSFVETTHTTSEWTNIKTVDNFTTIMRSHLFYKYSSDTKQIPYGSPKWLYMIGAFDVTPETSFYINGVKYVVIPDNYDSGAKFNYLIELNKD